ncbi:MAG: toprim domain-containing protein [Nanoarchaeota archaeon]
METIKDWILLLKHEKRPIIVEGKKDKKALEYFEIKNVITLDRPLYEIIELVSDNFEEVIILTDLDKAGKKIYSILSRELGKRGVRIEEKYRNFLFQKTQLTQIEGLVSYEANN